MATASARTLGDLQTDGIDRLVVFCGKCDRTGIYAVARLVNGHGEGERLPNLLAYLSRHCPKRAAAAMLDQCGARFLFDVE